MNGSLKINEVARGEYSAFVSPPENPMNLWDLAATQVILEEAGGRLTDLSGAPLDYRAADPQVNAGVIASNGVTHKVILERLARSAP
jgi:3'-phosphoadenosine 5'-phosphosulfate (PAPS) 3'-phosphatase